MLVIIIILCCSEVCCVVGSVHGENIHVCLQVLEDSYCLCSNHNNDNGKSTWYLVLDKVATNNLQQRWYYGS